LEKEVIMRAIIDVIEIGRMGGNVRMLLLARSGNDYYELRRDIPRGYESVGLWAANEASTFLDSLAIPDGWVRRLGV
jgi:hypothetical protein